jgi:hypothetical protein
MANTSSNLAAGAAITEGIGNGKRHAGRAAGLVATAILGLTLLIGGLLAHGRQAVAPGTSQTNAVAPHVSVAPALLPVQPAYREGHHEIYERTGVGLIEGKSPAIAGARIWTGTCRAGGSDCLPGDDDTAPALPSARPQGWTGTCRAGSSDCLPDEDHLLP